MSEGIKYDTDKLRMDLITPEFEKALAEILTMGAKKYGDRNWELGMDPNRIIAAMRRHMLAVRLGESVDPESGLSHLAHAACNLMFLVTYEARGMLDFQPLVKETPDE